MAHIIINGTSVPLPLLSFGAIKANKEIIEGMTTMGLDAVARTDNAVAFLKLAAPDCDFESATPGAIQGASLDLYRETFSRPEESASVLAASTSTGAN